ncbi:N-acetyltransferase [Ktedonosporobacter rubrisoli]|uniref:N-acetyltransferase n=1 Tax=Ktedonosporobacter rubrisoli TaxID=2509675 RepID=A0A4P6JI78_KTERU|nr:GNAT family N-acetyltransferase [Ktedonosporobacter rubrisoli]QBD74612.1 N-acetyltransferase [Ktedonosporobacter rubrisoli]
MSILIRDAVPDDNEAARSVQKQTWLATYPNEELGISREDIAAHFTNISPEARRRRELRKYRINTDPLTHLWVACKEDKIIGFCLATKEDGIHLVQALYVLPEYQGQGAGKRLLQAALDWLGTEHTVVLNVASYNERAIAFYRHFGFVITDNPPQAIVHPLPSGAVIPELEMIRAGKQE